MIVEYRVRTNNTRLTLVAVQPRSILKQHNTIFWQQFAPGRYYERYKKALEYMYMYCSLFLHALALSAKNVKHRNQCSDGLIKNSLVRGSLRRRVIFG
jgi:hypothetical protein